MLSTPDKTLASPSIPNSEKVKVPAEALERFRKNAEEATRNLEMYKKVCSGLSAQPLTS